MSTGRLTFNSPSYTIGTIAPDTTYTCGGKAKFGVESSRICIFMENEGDNVIVSPAIEYLSALHFYYYPDNQNYESSIGVYIKAEEDADWTEISGVAEYSKGTVYVNLPAKGAYKVKIQNKEGSKFYIQQIDYIINPETCSNCFRYVPE